MALDVKVKIDLVKPIGSVGLGIPLILTAETGNSSTDYFECYSMADVTTAGFTKEKTPKAYDMALAMFGQENAPEKIVIAYTQELGYKEWIETSSINKNTWRQIVVDADYDEELAAYIETTPDKMYFADVKDTDIASTTASYERTVLCAYKGTSTFSAAIVGATAGKEAGSYTYKNIVLNGVTADTYTETELAAVHAKNAIAVVTKAGDVVTSDGKNSKGEFVDVVDGKDYIISNLEYQTQKVLNNVDKVPYDNKGIAMLSAVAVNVLRDAWSKGIIATNEDGSAAYSVNYLAREDTSEADRSARKYLGGQFSFTLAGAIHEAEITGEIII